MAKIIINKKAYFSETIRLSKKREILKMIAKFEQLEEEGNFSTLEQIDAFDEMAETVAGCYKNENVTADAIFDNYNDFEDIQKLLGDIMGGQQDPKPQTKRQQHKKR
ncbi:phage tail assembly chaperone G [Brochothrix campestris]|uniref:Phage protein n=1 Tax=Brochothrix campestris FSL F6-1037 TaxID=1265861 RepID=W7CAE5_9LIST|nr:hypothetical protein [Brochothrix campestris]EUJ34275.1 hypothetical protein BCAMP_12416 [Brochothrix campestris FSL F6-1037]